MWLGILVAAAFITAAKLVVYPLADADHRAARP
jgi:hypothetical protein